MLMVAFWNGDLDDATSNTVKRKFEVEEIDKAA